MTIFTVLSLSLSLSLSLDTQAHKCENSNMNTYEGYKKIQNTAYFIKRSQFYVINQFVNANIFKQLLHAAKLMARQGSRKPN